MDFYVALCIYIFQNIKTSIDDMKGIDLYINNSLKS